jgi:hypothetical protein
MTAHLMFELSVFSLSHHDRHGWPTILSEFVATFGLLRHSRMFALPVVLHPVRCGNVHHCCVLVHCLNVLNSKKIQFYESTEPSDGVVLQNPQATITAQSGETVLVSRFDTEAFEFPCGYDMQIVLVFGHDRNLKQRYMHRFRICP